MKNNEHINEAEELKDAPLLHSLKKSEVFAAPDGYFDQLSSNIQDRINAKRPSVPQIFWKPVLAGTSLALIISAVYLITPSSTPQPKVQNSIGELQLSTDDLINSNYYQELEEDLLAEALIAPENESSLKESNLENYLLENSSEEELLNEL